MIAEVIVAALVAASPTPAASPVEQPATPIREVVYKVSTSERIDDITESYGGGPNAVPPSSTRVDEDHGTVTVDVMAKFEDGVLGVKISEQWKSGPPVRHFTGAVAPDGTVDFASTTINAVTIELLPYFATRFVPGGVLSEGAHWSVNKVDGNVSVVDDYTVTAVGNDSVTTHKDLSIKALGSETADGTIIYDPSSLLAISGQVRVRRTDMFADGQTMRTIDLRFDRVSDTFQAAAGP
jgi:hypothetical protein